MRVIHFGIILVLATAGFADTIVLKNGRVINGTYLGGSPRQVKVEAGDQITTLEVSDIARIEFSGGAAMPSSRVDDGRPTMRRGDGGDSSGGRPTLRRADNAAPRDDPDRPVVRRGEGDVVFRPDTTPAPAAPPRDPVNLPAGTNLVVRMIDPVDSETAHVGQTYAASLDEPVMLNGEAVIPRGADITVKLVDSKESGKLTGKAELTLDLVSIRVNGKMVDINTQSVQRESDSRGAKTAKVAGGTAAVGAIIGAIAGGGKGAAIGAGAGAAAGAGAQVVTKGQKVKIPSETRLTFVLESDVRI
ncbi:MAG TPA: hypothetical protein VKJ01_04545 [Candidatus Solibacter sp.]|nr:hypothetical protein [Candidatus Solibacter sp.]